MIFKTMNINDLNEEMTSHYFPMLTDARKEKILKLKEPNDRSIAFCSEILARQCLSSLCDAPEFAFSLLCNPNSKSVVGNFDAEISISQQDDFIACAVSNNYIGIGISKIQPFSFKDAQNLLTDSEIRAVFSDSKYSFNDIINQPCCNEDASMTRYAAIVSLKDAAFYASGRGVRTSIKSISFSFNGSNMICSDESYIISECFIDKKERFAVSVIERCKK